MIRFTDEPLRAVLKALSGPGPVTFEAVDPDRCAGRYDGELIEVGDHRCRARGYAGWVQVAEAVGGRLGTPEKRPDGFVRMTITRLDPTRSWHAAGASGDPEKYGADSAYARIDKFESAPFLTAFERALRGRTIATALSLGVHRGDELIALRAIHPDVECTGVDHAADALAVARERVPGTFVHADLNDPLEPGRFDLVLALNVLHSPALDGRGLFRRIVAEHLTPGGMVLVGLPNCRYIDGEVSYGARLKGHWHADLSALIRDAMFYRRYLHQHGFHVTVSGRHTLLIAGRRLHR